MKKIFMLTLILAFVLAACAPATPTLPLATPLPQATNTPLPAPVPTPSAAPVALPEIKIDAADYSYSAPETINAGWTRIILTNSGAEPHHVQFLRLNDGVTVQKFEDALKQAEGPALALTKQVGGVGTVHPGGTASAVINLPAGQYVILCLVPSPSDHVAHHMKGMIKSLTVAEGVSAAEPRADLAVRLKDYVYDLPANLPSGPLTIEVVNDGPEPHEFNIFKLEEGKTLNDVIQFLNGAGGPPPFAPVGGMNGLDTGLTGYAEVNLAPGNYVAICNIPSPLHEGHPHFALGMISAFTVGDVASASFPTGKFIKAGETDYGLEFKNDGSFQVFQGNTIYIHATYEVDGDTLTETSNDGGCKTNVSFKYTFDGKNLTLKYAGNPDDDTSCDGRHADFNNVTYTLSK